MSLQQDSVNLQKFSDQEKKDAIRAKRRMDEYQKKTFFEQLLINAKNKGYSITAIFLLLGGSAWQKDNILEVIYPFEEHSRNQEIAEMRLDHIEQRIERIEEMVETYFMP